MTRAHVSRQFLIQLFLNPCLGEPLTHSQWQDIIFVLRKEQLLARFAIAFKGDMVLSKLDNRVQRHFDNALKLAEHQQKQIRFEVKKLTEYLSNKVSQLVFMKGAAYVASGCLASMGRVCGDIDAIVPREDLGSAEQSLLLAGWYRREINEYDDLYYRKWAHEIPPLTHGVRGTVLDLHHNIVPVVSGRHVDGSILMSHSETLKSGVTVLTEPAQFVHSSIHLFFNEDFKYAFRDLFDLYLLTKKKDLTFWIHVFSIAAELNFKNEVYYAVTYLKACFDIQLHSDIEQQLSKQFKTSVVRDAIFLHGISPKHDMCTSFQQNIALALLTVRGHFLKMPLRILVYHLTVKSVRTALENLFGKHIFTKADKNNTFR